MARKVINVCDIDGSDDRVETYEIKHPESGRKVKADLCRKHSDLLETLLSPEDANPTTATPSAPQAGRRRARVSRVTPMAEIEAQKAAQGASAAAGW